MAAGFNVRQIDGASLGVSLDETTTRDDVVALWRAFAGRDAPFDVDAIDEAVDDAYPAALARRSPFLTHPVFRSHRSETQMLRYLRRLADKDLALDRTMIPLGSCTMKLNATAEMLPVTWPAFGALHPFAPPDQTRGYVELVTQLSRMLCAVTGYDAVSLQPNAGSQGEYAGLLMIRAYHASRGQTHRHRDVCLIPASAHGTNPASAQMAGMRVVVVACDRDGNVDLADLEAKAAAHHDDLAAIMVTYPSTHGVFEPGIVRICEIVHAHGGQVYVDGANLNALVGLAAPGSFGADVSHLNLHKTFCIPHGGGGPGVGPVACRAHLAPFLPGHRALPAQRCTRRRAGRSAPCRSALRHRVDPADLVDVRHDDGRARACALRPRPRSSPRTTSRSARAALSGALQRPRRLVAHECILDLRPLKALAGIEVEDVAKRLIDYGFHAPTMSFPVAGTLMVEPTESESKDELDRFIDAMIAIRDEMRAIEDGALDRDDNPLKHAPHTAAARLRRRLAARLFARACRVSASQVSRTASTGRPVARVDNVYGDRNLFCSCIPVNDEPAEAPQAVASALA